MPPLIQALVTVGRLPADARLHFGHPSVLALPGGRILLAVDVQGPDVRELPGTKGRYGDTHHWLQGRLYASPDDGQTWVHKLDFPFGHPCLFRDGNHLYLLGQRGSLQILRSADGGETWSKPAELAPRGGDAGLYAHSPCNVLLADGRFFVPLLRAPAAPGAARPAAGALSPVLLVAAEGTNLTLSKSWQWSEAAPPFEQLAPWDTLDGFGLPFFDITPAPPGKDRQPRPWALRPGWSYPHAVCISDPDHVWHDPARRVIHLVAAAGAHRANLAALARATEQPDGTWRVDLPTVPSGRRQAFLPLPGGNRKFHLLADAETRHHWLLSGQYRESMRRLAPAPGGGRPSLPADRAHLLQLSFSGNLVDWVQAGWVAGAPDAPLTEPAMDIRGRDLCVTALGPDPEDPARRSGKQLVFGLLRDFRSLLYGRAST